MADYETQAARETAAEMQCPEPEPYVERFQKRALGQDDVRTARGRTRAELEAVEQVPAWRYHYRGALAPPTWEADRSVAFEALHPETIPLMGGLPTPLPHDLIEFNDQEMACARGGKGPAVATTMRVDGSNAELIGREVDELFQWIEAQRALATSIESIAPVMTTLRDNGILDADFAIADGAHIDALLADVARAGRVDAYPPGSEAADRSVQALEAAGRVTDCDAELMNDMASIERFEGASERVQLSLRAAKAGVNAYYARRTQQAEEREAASLAREKADTMAWLDAFSLSGSAVSMHKGGMTRGAAAGPAAIAVGALDVFMQIGKLAAHKYYEGLITQAYDRIGKLRARTEAFESTQMMTKLEALVREFNVYVDLVENLRAIAVRRRVSQTHALSAFGAVASDVVRGMRRDRAPTPGDPFDAGDRRSQGRVQRLFANIPLYEQVSAFNRGARWPRLRGKIPMSGYLAGIGDPRGLPRITEEAARLRWWQERTDAVGVLHDRARRAIDAIGPSAQSAK